MSAIKMVAKFAGRCAGCGGSIAVGESILWAKGSPARHERCGNATAPAAPGARGAGSQAAHSFVPVPMPGTAAANERCTVPTASPMVPVSPTS